MLYGVFFLTGASRGRLISTPQLGFWTRTTADDLERNTSGGEKINFSPKTGIPDDVVAKGRYILKPSTNHTPGALRFATLTSHPSSA